MRSSLSILLAILIATQAALSGLAICMDGGCCHAALVESEPDQHSCCDHDAAPLVNHDDEHDQDCDCTDVVLSGIEGFTPGRDNVTLKLTITPVPVFDFARIMEVGLAPTFGAPPPRPLALGVHQPAHLRTTRLLL